MNNSYSKTKFINHVYKQLFYSNIVSHNSKYSKSTIRSILILKHPYTHIGLYKHNRFHITIHTHTHTKKNNMINSEDTEGYLILRPEELRPFELLRLLLSGDIEKPRSIDSSETKEPSFRRRWLIFVSLALLKILRFLSEPLALFGSALEFSLNFLSDNSFSAFFLRGLNYFHTSLMILICSIVTIIFTVFQCKLFYIFYILLQVSFYFEIYDSSYVIN